MAQLSAVITTSDSDFRSTITALLRSSGVSIGIIDEKHAGGTWPDLAVVDIRNGTLVAVEAIERLRAQWPSTSIFAVAASSEPDQILRAMRAGANEYLTWSFEETGTALTGNLSWVPYLVVILVAVALIGLVLWRIVKRKDTGL